MVHEEVPIKVTAWVDRGVAPIVEALNQFENVITIDSCEGSDESPAYVYFNYRGTPDAFSAFVQDVSAALGSRLRACCEYRISLEWLAGAEAPTGHLSVQRGFLAPLAETLRSIAVKDDRMTVLGDDSACIAPHNC